MLYAAGRACVRACVQCGSCSRPCPFEVPRVESSGNEILAARKRYFRRGYQSPTPSAHPYHYLLLLASTAWHHRRDSGTMPRRGSLAWGAPLTRSEGSTHGPLPILIKQMELQSQRSHIQTLTVR